MINVILNMCILFKSNNLALLSDNTEAERREFSSNDVVEIIDSCTSLKGDNDVVIDATALQRKLFPTPHRMIFISHLSDDIGLVRRIKQTIEDYAPNYCCFLDSDLWGNIYKAQSALQNKYAYDTETGLYYLETTNNIAKHLHMTLSMALTKAIKASPFFLYVPTIGDIDEDSEELITKSPWVCHELLTSSLLWDFVPLKESVDIVKAAARLGFNYKANISHLHLANLDAFIKLINKY